MPVWQEWIGYIFSSLRDLTASTALQTTNVIQRQILTPLCFTLSIAKQWSLSLSVQRNVKWFALQSFPPEVQAEWQKYSLVWRYRVTLSAPPILGLENGMGWMTHTLVTLLSLACPLAAACEPPARDRLLNCISLLREWMGATMCTRVWLLSFTKRM